MARFIPRNMSPVRKIRFDSIVGADTHIREDCPVCREPEEYMKAQWTKLDFIKALCAENHCPFLHAGDLFDHWRPSPWLISMALEHLPAMTIVAPGQHDLANHSLVELPKTGLQTLAQAGRVLILAGGFERVLGDPARPLASVSGYAYGETAKDALKSDKNRKYALLWHHLTCYRDQPWPDAGADEPHTLFRSLPGYDLIVTGDNHQQFTARSGNAERWIINPGSMMRMSTDQKDFEPAVFGWCAKNNSVTRIPLPIKKGVVSREHLGKEKKESRDLRISAYIKRAQKSYEAKLSFIENLKAHIKKNKVEKEVEELIWKAVGE